MKLVISYRNTLSLSRLFFKISLFSLRNLETAVTGCLVISVSFKEFAGISESVFKNSERRNDLDKAYHHLIRVVFENVERMAEEHQKTPRAVVMMGKRHSSGL